jgi:hypothetical protein
MEKIFKTFIVGLLFILISYFFGFLKLSGVIFYDFFSILSFFVIASVLFLPKFSLEIGLFLLFLPFWTYFNSYGIFAIKLKNLSIDYQYIFLLIWSIKYIFGMKISRKNNFDIIITTLFVLVTVATLLSTLKTYDMKAHIIGYNYGVFLPFLLFLITRNAFRKGSATNQYNVFQSINRAIVFHVLFTIYIEFSNQNFFNIVSQYGRITGIFGNTLFVTLICIFQIPLILFMINNSKNKLQKTESTLSLLVIILTLLLTASRGGIVILVVYMTYYVVSDIKRFKIKKIMSFAFIFILSIIALVYLFPSTYNILINRGFDSNFLETSRLEYQVNIIKFMSNDFFNFVLYGRGISNFQNAYSLIDFNTVTTAHNFFITTMFELGILVSIGYFLIILLLFLHNKNSLSKIISLQLLGFLIYGLIIGGSLILIPSIMSSYDNVLNLFPLLLSLSIGLKISSINNSLSNHKHRDRLEETCLELKTL